MARHDDHRRAHGPLDAALEPHGLVTSGPYRVRVTAGTTTLEVGVAEAGCG